MKISNSEKYANTDNNMHITKQNEQQKTNDLLSFKKQGKRGLMQEKKIAKFDEDINRVIKNILNENNKEALRILKKLINDGNYLDRHEFQGIGNVQNWKEYYPNGPLQWLTQSYQGKQPPKNPFDLLSIVFMIDKTSNNVKMEDIHSTYISYLDKLPEMHFEIYLGLGNAYFNDYQFLKAQRYYLQALEYKQNERLFEYLAWLKGEAFDIDEEAVEYCNKCLTYNPQNRGALYVKAVCHNKVQEIFGILQDLTIKFPQYYKLYYSLAYYCDFKKDAVVHCTKALKYDPKYCKAYMYKARMLEKKSKQSVQMYENSLRKFSSNYVCFFELGMRQKRRNHYSDAIYYFEKTLEINPYHYPAMKAMAQAYNETDKGMSQFYYIKFLELNPYDCEVYNSLGLIYDENNQSNEAIKYYRKGLQVNPKHFDCLLNLGQSYQSNEQYNQALQQYLKAFAVKSSAEVSYGLAICYHYLDQRQKAEQWGLKCIRLGGDQQNEVYQFLGDHYFSHGQYSKALQYYLKYSCVTEQLHTEYIMQNMISQIEQEQVLAAMKHCQNQPPDYDKVFWFLQLGKLYITINRQVEAGECYKQVKDIQGDESEYQIVREQLRRFFGCPQEGYFCVLDQRKLQSLKGQFFQAFLKSYQSIPQ